MFHVRGGERKKEKEEKKERKEEEEGEGEEGEERKEGEGEEGEEKIRLCQRTCLSTLGGEGGGEVHLFIRFEQHPKITDLFVPRAFS